MNEFRRLRAIDPVGAKASAAAVRALADDPRPEGARALGTSGYFRLHVGAWRVLYRPDRTTVTVHVLKVGRST
ncbi:type II toxin-antitoxin system RelE/ParE family toxin [Streptomyces sp. NPDC046915]|uniref:type II toxin-antitoxin system RelE family toxin n=1 Tax=Streptomyces sp. NPDC046915 TaxID=3155257 RepID=UPI0033F74F8C